ncbi:MAG: PAS domain S-box protein [Sandaracinus sp.]|nr:PAS domain S-box protein [Sandaracinus sp.]
MAKRATVALMRGHYDELTDADDVFLAIVGYSREELESGRLNWREMTPPEHRHLDDAGMREAAASGGFTAPYQKEFIRKDGSRVPVLLVCAFIPGMPGHWMGYVVTLETPKPQRATPAYAVEPLNTLLKLEMMSRLVSELVRERSRMLAMLDHTPALMWSFDRECRLLSANEPFFASVTRSVGRRIGVGDSLLDFAEDDSNAAQWREWYRRVLEGEGFQSSIRVTASTDMLETRFEPIFDASGEIVGGTVVAQDVTLRVQAERDLRASESRFRGLAETLPVGIFLVEPSGEIYFRNRAFESLLHDAPLSMVEELDQVSQELVDEIFESGGPAERVVRAPDGSRTVRVRVQRVENDGCLGIVEDETERLAFARREQQREKMESLGALAGGIAHDFNNLLGIVLGFAERAMEEPGSSPESLAAIRTASLRARGLVQQILAFGRRQDHAMEPLDLGALVVETSRLLRVAIPATIVLDTNVPRESIVVRGDPSALQQVLVNLCTNAAHALRGRELGSIHVRLVANADDAELVVEDDGPGFPPDVEARLFEPFFTTKPIGEGTGMGLAVAHGIVTSHGGEITAKSTPRGARFAIRLPRSDAELTGSRVAPPRESVKARILIAEDEPLLSRVVARTLGAAGHQVTARPSATEAYALLHEKPDAFDLVLTDLTMPGMNGIELLRKARALCPELVGVVMSGNAELTGADVEGWKVLQKPFLAQELLEAVETALSRLA